jgi:hypothetical protein
VVIVALIFALESPYIGPLQYFNLILMHFHLSILHRLSCEVAYQILNKLFECLKAPKNDSSVIQGLHPILAQASKIVNRWHQLVHNSRICRTLSSLYGFDKVIL